MIKLNPIDRKILHRMQHDSTESLEQLGDHVGLSRNACWRRVKILQERGYIEKQVALLSPQMLDLGLTVFIQLRTNSHDAAWMAQFAKATQSLPEILGVYRMSGDLDYLIKARVSDVDAYDRLYRKLIAQVPLSDVSASFVMEEIKETTALPVL